MSDPISEWLANADGNYLKIEGDGFEVKPKCKFFSNFSRSWKVFVDKFTHKEKYKLKNVSKVVSEKFFDNSALVNTINKKIERHNNSLFARKIEKIGFAYQPKTHSKSPPEGFKKPVDEASCKACLLAAIRGSNEKAAEYVLNAHSDMLQELANKGDVDVQLGLAHCFEKGLGVKKSPATAFQFYRLSAKLSEKRNNSRGDVYFHLGRCYENGIGTASSLQEAKTWYKKAEDRGFRIEERELATQLQNCSDDSIQGASFGVYLVANEVNKKAVIAKLKENAPENNPGVHIGCSGLYNFDLMCIRKPAYGVIFDYNQNNKIFINSILECIKTSPSRQECAEAIQSYIDKDKEKDKKMFAWDDNARRAEIYKNFSSELNREGSWLSSDENYNYIKSLVDKERITAITQDVKNVQVFTRIKTMFAVRDIPVDTVYTSNITDFVGKDNKSKEGFTESLACITDAESLVVSAPPKETRTQDQQSSGKIPLQVLPGRDVRPLLFTNTLQP